MGYTSEPAVFAFRHLNKTVGTSLETQALTDISFEIRRGEFVLISGTSGSGKSTLLSIMGLWTHPTRGSYRLNGVEVRTLTDGERIRVRAHDIGYVFQSCNLTADWTAYENIERPLRDLGMSLRERRDRTNRALERIEMTHRAKHVPSQLSSGEQQCLAVARALAGEPAIVLADEPTGTLDSESGEIVMELLRERHLRGSTICMVTHVPRYALNANRHIRLVDGRMLSPVDKAPRQRVRAVAPLHYSAQALSQS